MCSSEGSAKCSLRQLRLAGFRRDMHSQLRLGNSSFLRPRIEQNVAAFLCSSEESASDVAICVSRTLFVFVPVQDLPESAKMRT